MKLLRSKPRKKEISLTGKLLYPLEIGMPAVILESEGLRRTSSVCRVKTGNAYTIEIETQNTIYVLKEGEEYGT